MRKENNTSNKMFSSTRLGTFTKSYEKLRSRIHSWRTWWGRNKMIRCTRLQMSIDKHSGVVEQLYQSHPVWAGKYVKILGGNTQGGNGTLAYISYILVRGFQHFLSLRISFKQWNTHFTARGSNLSRPFANTCTQHKQPNTRDVSSNKFLSL